VRQHRYIPRGGPQAIDPQALFGLFDELELQGNLERADATIVTIRGPLSQHAGFWGDSYEAILARVVEACAKAAPAVLLRIDSPGGEVAGCFDTARAIRAACDRAQKRLLVHVEGECASAAYALACVADRIVASPTAKIGSIGIIAVRFDDTAADAMTGHNVALITSGQRKADGNPHAPLSADELLVHQQEVDGLAGAFFALVAVYRSLTPQKIAAYEAASFRGGAAVQAGFVDELGSFDHLLASLGGAQQGGAMDKEEEAREALRSIAEDEERDEKARAKARRALAALDDEEEEDACNEPRGQDDDEDEEEATAEATTTAAAPSPTVSAATAGALANHGAVLESRLAALERQHEAERRTELIKAHGAVPPALAKLLATKPLAEVETLLAAVPKPKKPRLGEAAATAVVAGTRGSGRASRLSPEQAKAMDRVMGLEKPEFGVVKRGSVLMLGAPLDDGGK